MSPSCSTIPPISWTSKMRWSESRLRASRTAANASKSRSSSDSPFSSRCRNSAVFARRSSSLRASNSGSSVVMYAACSCSRLRRRPSPRRRTFSKLPSCCAISGQGTGLQRGDPDLPEVAVEPLRTHGVRPLGPLELGYAAERAQPVDRQRPLTVDDRQVDRVAVDLLRELDDVDPPRRDGPQFALAAHGL